MNSLRIFLWVVLLHSPLLVRAADWPQFGGPNRDGVSLEKSWNAQFPADGPKKLWEKAVGKGASSVAVVGGRVFTMGNVDNKDIVYCLDGKTGKEIWRFAYDCDFAARSFEGGTAATPTVDGNLVFTLSYDGQLHAIDAQKGTLVWSKNLAKLGGQGPKWGYAGSPLVEKDLLIIDAGGSGSSTIAFNKKDGTPVWKAGDDGAGYASPIAATIGGKRMVIIFKAKALVGIDPANGKELWRHKWETSYDVNAATPSVIGDRVLVSSGYGRGGAVLDLSSGQPQVVWENRKLAAQMATPVVWQGHAYAISGQAGKGSLVCVDLKDGEQKWSEPSSQTGALSLADGKLIVLGERGELIIAKADPAAFQAISRAQVLKAKCWVMPVLANGVIYCRSNTGDLIALDATGK